MALSFDDYGVLMLAPTRRDGEVMGALFERAGVNVESFTGSAALAARTAQSAGAIVLSDAVLADPSFELLVDALSRQPSWSDLPLIMLCRPAVRAKKLRGVLDVLKNVTVLERPTTSQTLLSSVQAALRARARQYQLRDHFDALGSAASALRARERQLETLTENTPDILSRFDRTFRHVFVNRAAAELTGLDTTAFIGRTNRDLGMPEHLCALWDEALESVFQTGQARALAFEYEHAEGTKYFDNMLVPETNEHGVVHTVLCVAHDRTKTRQAERALHIANRRKDEFLAMLAHELRNPLAPISNATDILLTLHDHDEQVRALAEIVRRQASLMTRMVDDLLDVSRITEGRIELKCAHLAIAEVVAHAVESVQPLFREKHQSVCVKAADDPLFINGDAARLVQSLTNVLTNAAKYTDAGGEIRIDTRRSGSRVVVSVEDSGVGIAADMLESIFEPFVQGERSIDRSQGGLGIGLAVVQRLVGMHGGLVRAVSAGVGRGARFDIELPLVEAPGAISDAQPEVDGGGRKILVVDDNRDAADTLALLLALSGHCARAVYSSNEALALAAAFEPDVVLLDIGLPQMDGYEVAARLRETDAKVKIVAVTGYGQDEDVRRAKFAGFYEHVVKPVDYGRLKRIIA